MNKIIRILIKIKNDYITIMFILGKIQKDNIGYFKPQKAGLFI
jgi:hypothetical protein